MHTNNCTGEGFQEHCLSPPSDSSLVSPRPHSALSSCRIVNQLSIDVIVQCDLLACLINGAEYNDVSKQGCLNFKKIAYSYRVPWSLKPMRNE